MANIQTNRWQLSRRSMLRGMGATMALPFLEAMRPLTAAAQTAKGAKVLPVRMACLFMPNGVRPDRWTPAGTGSEYELSPILSPLESLKKELLVISGLTNKPAHKGDGHYYKTASWLTCTTIEKTQGSNISANGISIDQMAASAIGQETGLPSMELGIEPVNTGVDHNVQLTRLYGSHIAWKQPNLPLPCEINPRSAFDRLFRHHTGGKKTPAISPDKSILDIVMEDAKNLKRSLGSEDTQKLDQYLESVREVERRISNEAKQLVAGQNISEEALKQVIELDRKINKSSNRSLENQIGSRQRIDPTDHVRLMMDLMVLAFWTDSTRVSTFMFAKSVSNKNFSFLDGVTGSHHSISHHKNDPKQLDQYQRINTWHIEQYAYMLERMRNIKEDDSTLLDNSMVLFGSGIRDGNRHSPHDLPTVLAGKAGGKLNTGRHLATKQGTPLASLYHGMLSRVGAPVEQIGNADRELDNL